MFYGKVMAVVRDQYKTCNSSVWAERTIFNAQSMVHKVAIEH